MPSHGARSPQKKKQKRGQKNSRKASRKNGLIINEEIFASSQDAGYEKKSEFVKALLNHKAKEGVKERQNNGGRMPHLWYTDAIKSLKSNPGCSKIDFKRSDLENRVRKIVKEAEKQNAPPPVSSLTSSGGDALQTLPRPQPASKHAVTSGESQSESGQSPSDESEPTQCSPPDSHSPRLGRLDPGRRDSIIHQVSQQVLQNLQSFPNRCSFPGCGVPVG